MNIVNIKINSYNVNKIVKMNKNYLLNSEYVGCKIWKLDIEKSKLIRRIVDRM